MLESLADEVLLLVFDLLRLPQRVCLKQVSKRFNRLLNDGLLIRPNDEVTVRSDVNMDLAIDFIVKNSSLIYSINLSRCEKLNQSFFCEIFDPRKPILSKLREATLHRIPRACSNCLFQLPNLERVQLFDASSLCITKPTVNQVLPTKLKSVIIFHAKSLTYNSLPVLIQPSLEQLCLSYAQNVNNKLLRYLNKLVKKSIDEQQALLLDENAPVPTPRLQLAELTLFHCGHMNTLDIRTTLEYMQESLVTLNLTGCDGFLSLDDDYQLPKLKHLILDSTFIESASLSRIFHQLPVLEFLSLIECRTNDAAFSDVDPRVDLHFLQQIFLSGTRITDQSVVKLKLLPQLRVLVIDSCRGVSRELRTEVTNRYRNLAACSIDFNLPNNSIISFNNHQSRSFLMNESDESEDEEFCL